MNEGRIIFKVTKAGVAVNSKWKVLLDGKCVGNIDFQNGLQNVTSLTVYTCTDLLFSSWYPISCRN